MVVSQDTNSLQYSIAARLASVHRNLFVVGDPDQSIYGWRYANASNVQRVLKDFPVSHACLLLPRPSKPWGRA